MEELQEDLHESLGINPDEIDQTSNPADILKKLMRHPDKLMKLVQKIQNKFQQKMSSGDLSQEDLMKEAGEMLRKMKDMGGNSKQMNEMFKNMAQNMGAGGNIGKNMKVDTNRLDRMLKSQDIKDRLRSKLDKKKKQDNFVLEQTKTPNNLVYRPADDDSKQEKTFMTDEQINAIAKDIGDVTKPTAPKKKKKHKKPAA
jgi:ATP-dependent Lon protease